MVWCNGSSDRSLMLDSLRYFSFQPVLHDWCISQRLWYVLSCLLDGAYKRFLAANWKVLHMLSSPQYAIKKALMVDSLRYFSFQPVLHDRCIKGHGVRYPIFRMVHIKDSLLLFEKSIQYSGSSRFLLLLSDWSFTIYLMAYNHK